MGGSGFYAEDGRFDMQGVTGPDEYTTVVNDNPYTNLMAWLNLRYAVESVRRLEAENPCGLVSEVGDDARALEYFRFALMMDFGDIAGSTSDGVHVAAAGGVWQALVFGFGGVRDAGGELPISPGLPGAWESPGFSLRFRDRQLRIELGRDEDRYLVEEGDPLELTIRGERRRLEEGSAVVVPRG